MVVRDTASSAASTCVGGKGVPALNWSPRIACLRAEVELLVERLFSLRIKRQEIELGRCGGLTHVLTPFSFQEQLVCSL
jgi:hypothetical protein